MKFYILLLISALLGMTACKHEEKETAVHVVTIHQPIEVDTVEIEEEYDSTIHHTLAEIGLIDLSLLDTTIQIDLRYSTENNFMKMRLYDSIDRLFLQKDVAERLVKCQSYLKELAPTYSLLVYDGVRPLNVQQQMWDALDSIPASRRGKFVSNPRNGSVHNYGAAVDLTICDSLGVPLDMGAGYDDFREIAFPKYEQRFLNSGELTHLQYENRKLLRKVMRSEAFYNIPSEWWHFNACRRNVAKEKYPQLLFESGN